MAKLSDKEFWDGLRASGGIFARAVRYFKENNSIEITRQGVYKRAHENEKLLKDIEEECIDAAEEVLMTFIREKAKGEAKLRLDAVKFYLKTKGKDRGYAPAAADKVDEIVVTIREIE